MRPISIQRNYTSFASGSVLISVGNTKVVCTATLEERVPQHVNAEQSGWLTAEYGMLPGATFIRNDREAAQGKQKGRTIEIQRLIGRSLRCCVDLTKIPGWTILVDCDVLMADAGTRTASITGSCVAVYDGLKYIGKLEAFAGMVAAISVGMVENEPRLDLDYTEDSSAETDMNVVMFEDRGFVEIQGTAEKKPFSNEDLSVLLEYASRGIEDLFAIQHEAVAKIQN